MEIVKVTCFESDYEVNVKNASDKVYISDALSQLTNSDQVDTSDIKKIFEGTTYFFTINMEDLTDKDIIDSLDNKYIFERWNCSVACIGDIDIFSENSDFINSFQSKTNAFIVMDGQADDNKASTTIMVFYNIV